MKNNFSNRCGLPSSHAWRFIALIILSNFIIFVPWQPIRAFGAGVLILMPGLLIVMRYFGDDEWLAQLSGAVGIGYSLLVLGALSGISPNFAAQSTGFPSRNFPPMTTSGFLTTQAGRP